MEKQNLYFVAIVLPEELSKKVISIQTEIAACFESQKSLRVVPHITLKAPFTLSASMHSEVVKWFDNLLININYFSVDLWDFGSFPNPKSPVIYIKLMGNAVLLKLQQDIIQQFYKVFSGTASGTEINFKPHVTVAYRDLKPEIFLRAWQEFKDRKFSESFVANSFELLQHDGKKWNVIKTFRLN